MSRVRTRPTLQRLSPSRRRIGFEPDTEQNERALEQAAVTTSRRRHRGAVEFPL